MKPVTPLDPHELLEEAKRVTSTPDQLIGYMLREVTDKQSELIAAHNELLARTELRISELEKHTHDVNLDQMGEVETTLPRFVRVEPEHD